MGAEWADPAKCAGPGDALPPILFSHLESNAAVLGIPCPGFTSPLVVELDEDGLHEPAPQSPEPGMTLAFPSRSVVHTELSTAEIGTISASKKLQTFHSRSNHEKKQMHLCEGEPGGPITPTHHSDVKLKKEVYDIIMPSRSVQQVEDAMNA